MIRLLIKKNIKNIACRVSDEEDLKTAINLKNKIKWIWFETQFAFKKSYSKLRKLKKINSKYVLYLQIYIRKKLNLLKVKYLT